MKLLTLETATQKRFFLLGILGSTATGFVLLTVLGGLSCSAGDAQQEAETWAREMGLEGPIACAKQDSDGDGYVSCTYRDKTANVQPIECGTKNGCNAGGCRVPQPKTQGKAQ